MLQTATQAMLLGFFPFARGLVYQRTFEGKSPWNEAVRHDFNVESLGVASSADNFFFWRRECPVRKDKDLSAKKVILGVHSATSLTPIETKPLTP